MTFWCLDGSQWRWRDGRLQRADRPTESGTGVGAPLHRAVTAWEGGRGETSAGTVGRRAASARRATTRREAESHWTGARQDDVNNSIGIKKCPVSLSLQWISFNLRHCFWLLWLPGLFSFLLLAFLKLFIKFFYLLAECGRLRWILSIINA